jgi:uncharacterized membrane protein YesL
MNGRRAGRTTSTSGMGTHGSGRSLLQGASALGYASVLWWIACLPVITAGPATVALHRAVLQWHRDHDRTPTWREFLAHTRSALRSGALVGMILCLGSAALVVDTLFMARAGNPVLLGMVTAIAPVWWVVVAPTWVLLASGESPSALRSIADSIWLLTRRPVRSLGVAAAWCVPWLLVLILPPAFGVIATVVVPGGTAWLSVLALTWRRDVARSA